jgi:hypothetical protein
VNDGLHVPSTLSPRLAANSTGLSIDAWILPRSGSSSNAFRMILEKGLLKHASTTVQGSTALAPGYAFYLCGGGRLGFQMPDPNYDPMRFEPAMAPMTMDEWHHVAVTVDPQKPQGGQLYLDGVGVGTFTPPSGILGNLADLYIGRFTPQLGPAAPDSAFNGDIDEVEIFVSAIDSSAVRKIWSAGCSGKRRVQVLTNSVVTLRENGAAAEICSSVLNLSDVAHTYQWSIAGGTPGVGCPSSVPVAFAPSSGSVTVAAGARADFSTSASVSPVSLTSPFTRCFRLTVTDLADGGVLTADGSLVFTGQPVTGKASCTPPEIGGATFAPTGMVRAASGLATFTLFNDAAAGVTVNYSIATRDPETGSASALLRLGGLPAGTPLTGSLFVPGLGSADLPFAVGLDEYEPFLPDEVVLSADGGGNLVFKELASVHQPRVRGCVPGQRTAAPPRPGAPRGAQSIRRDHQRELRAGAGRTRRGGCARRERTSRAAARGRVALRRRTSPDVGRPRRCGSECASGPVPGACAGGERPECRPAVAGPLIRPPARACRPPRGECERSPLALAAHTATRR